MLLKGSKFIDHTKLEGTMYSLGSYPMLMKNGYQSYDAEIYEVPDEVYVRVSAMEIGAGYYANEVDGSTVFYGKEDYPFDGKEIIDEY